MRVGIERGRATGERGHQHQKRRARQMEVRHQRIDDPPIVTFADEDVGVARPTAQAIGSARLRPCARLERTNHRGADGDHAAACGPRRGDRLAGCGGQLQPLAVHAVRRRIVVAHRAERTREFKVTVFEHPRLERADAVLTYPEYTRLPPKRIEDTRRVSAVEGTRLDLTLQLNKPVKAARFVARGPGGETLELKVDPARAVANLEGFTPAKSTTYELRLVDAEDRANKVAASFVFDVQPNRPPEIRLALPRGDIRPSALEEVTFDGTVWDDFGVPLYGIGYSLAGGETTFVELGRDAAAREKRMFGHLLSLEGLGAKPDDLVSWFAWAEDIGPDGKVRRTTGDLFFGEVRPFDEIFRERQNQGGEDEGQQGGQRGRRLAELQKQIISATWKLRRDGERPGYAADAKVVLESQRQALAQAGEADRFLAKWRALRDRVAARRIAFVEDQIDHGRDGGEPFYFHPDTRTWKSSDAVPTEQPFGLAPEDLGPVERALLDYAALRSEAFRKAREARKA